MGARHCDPLFAGHGLGFRRVNVDPFVDPFVDPLQSKMMGNVYNCLIYKNTFFEVWKVMERAMRFELTTLTLAR